MNLSWSYIPKRSIQVKIAGFSVCVALKFDGWMWKSIGHHLYTSTSFAYHFCSLLWIETGFSALKRPNWGQICFHHCEHDIWLLTLTSCMNIASINGNNSWKCHNDTNDDAEDIVKKVWRTDGQTDWTIQRSVWPQIKGNKNMSSSLWNTVKSISARSMMARCPRLNDNKIHMMPSSNGNTFRVTDPLCG